MNNLTAASNTFLSASKSAHIRGLNHKKHKGMTQLPLHQSEVLLEHKSHVNFGKLHHSILSFSSTFDFARVQIPLVNSHRHTDTHTHTLSLSSFMWGRVQPCVSWSLSGSASLSHVRKDVIDFSDSALPSRSEGSSMLTHVSNPSSETTLLSYRISNMPWMRPINNNESILVTTIHQTCWFWS